VDDAEYRVIGYIALPIVLLVCFAPFILAWTGRYRGFAVAPLPFYRLSKRNIFPFTLFCGGLLLVTMLAGAMIPGLSAEEAPALWNAFWVVIWAEIALVAVSLFTWPRFLAPPWYRDWLERGGTQETSVYSPEEHGAGAARRVNRHPGDDREAGWLLKRMLGQGAPGAGKEMRNHER
jgi:hypothetical protein